MGLGGGSFNGLFQFSLAIVGIVKSLKPVVDGVVDY